MKSFGFIIMMICFLTKLQADTSAFCPGETGFYFTNYSSRNPQKGGFISSTSFVEDSGELFLAPTAAVCGFTMITGSPKIAGNVIVRGNVEIEGDPTIIGNLIIEGETKVIGMSAIKGSGILRTGIYNNQTLILNDPNPHLPAGPRPGTTPETDQNPSPSRKPIVTLSPKPLPDYEEKAPQLPMIVPNRPATK